MKAFWQVVGRVREDAEVSVGLAPAAVGHHTAAFEERTRCFGTSEVEAVVVV